MKYQISTVDIFIYKHYAIISLRYYYTFLNTTYKANYIMSMKEIKFTVNNYIKISISNVLLLNKTS
jgi:hypothetical protein